MSTEAVGRGSGLRGSLGRVVLAGLLACGVGPLAACRAAPTPRTVNVYGLDGSMLPPTKVQEATLDELILVAVDASNPGQLARVDCSVAATYQYHPIEPPQLDSRQIQSSEQLATSLPLLAASIEGHFDEGASLVVESIAVGSYVLAPGSSIAIPKRPEACARATHYVSELTVGAYQVRQHTELAVQSAGEASKGTVLGSLAACPRSTEQGCRSPLRATLVKIADSQRTEVAAGPTKERPKPQVDQDLGYDEVIVRKGYGLELDETQWRPGHFMAKSLERLLAVMVYVTERWSYGLDARASCIAAGYVNVDHDIVLARELEAEVDYLVFATGAMGGALSLEITDASGQAVARDEGSDGLPVVQLRPADTQLYSITVDAAQEDFGSIAVMRSGGYSVPPSLLHGVFQNLLDVGAAASQRVAKQSSAQLVFYEGNLSLFGTILHPKESIRQGPMVLRGASTVFLGAGHDPSVDLDIVLLRQDGTVLAEDRDDAMPVVIVPEGTRESVTFSLEYANGTETTLGASLVLELLPTGGPKR